MEQRHLQAVPDLETKTIKGPEYDELTIERDREAIEELHKQHDPKNIDFVKEEKAEEDKTPEHKAAVAAWQRRAEPPMMFRKKGTPFVNVNKDRTLSGKARIRARRAARRG